MNKLMKKNVFAILFGILLISRLIVLTQTSFINFDWTLYELMYLFVLCAILCVDLYVRKIKIKIKNLPIIEILMGIYIFLFGLVLVNPLIFGLTRSNFLSHAFFVIVLLITGIYIKQNNLWRTFLFTSFYSIAIFMFIKLITNLNELNLTNIIYIFSTSKRVRSEFGFNHANTLGNVCLCVIILWSFINKYKSKGMIKLLNFSILAMAVAMMLCSASRSSITGTILFFGVNYLYSNKNGLLNKKSNQTLKVIGVIFVLIVVTSYAIGMSFTDVLEDSNRDFLFTHTIPMFLKTDRVMIGLGFASNVAYGDHLTPYLTYFLDNGFVYTFVATGVVGSLIYLLNLCFIGKNVFAKTNNIFRSNLISLFIIYLYVALFEATLFSSGFFTNYVFIVIFSVYIYDEKRNMRRVAR